MSAIPSIEEQVKDAIYGVQLERRKDRKPRHYLGGSEIGDVCDRKLWYSFRHALKADFPLRILRLFETGDQEEGRVIRELKDAGFEVYDRNRTLKQFQITALGGHFKGHCDGFVRIDSEWFLLELKTANKKRFNALDKHGVHEKKPEHVDQMQVYLGFAPYKWDEWMMPGEPPTRALYISVCKDNDHLHLEVVDFDPDRFQQLGMRAQAIIEADSPPSRYREDPGYYLCQWCDCHGICHSTDAPRVDCRTCCNATPDTETGQWRCEVYERPIPEDVLVRGCDEHVFISPLLEKRHGEVINWQPQDFERPIVQCVEYADGTLNAALAVKDQLISKAFLSREIVEIEKLPAVLGVQS